MVFHGQEGQKKGLADLFGRGKFWEGVDWTQTQRLRGRPRPDLLQPARPRGAGHRLRGRGVQGAAGRDRGQARAAQGPRHRRAGDARRLQARRHLQGRVPPDTRPTCRSASTTATAWAGRTRWAAISRAVVENNNRKWSGDHCATATEISGGVFFSNRKIAQRRAAHHGPVAHDPEAARGARSPPTSTASRSGDDERGVLVALAGGAAVARPPPQPRATAQRRRPRAAAPATDDDRAAARAGAPQALERDLEQLRGQEKSLLGEVERLELEVRLRGEQLRETQARAAARERADRRDGAPGARARGAAWPRRGPRSPRAPAPSTSWASSPTCACCSPSSGPSDIVPRLPVRERAGPPRQRAHRRLPRATSPRSPPPARDLRGEGARRPLALRDELGRARAARSTPTAQQQDRAAHLARREEGDPRRLPAGAGGGGGQAGAAARRASAEASVSRAHRRLPRHACPGRSRARCAAPSAATSTRASTPTPCRTASRSRRAADTPGGRRARGHGRLRRPLPRLRPHGRGRPRRQAPHALRPSRRGARARPGSTWPRASWWARWASTEPRTAPGCTSRCAREGKPQDPWNGWISSNVRPRRERPYNRFMSSPRPSLPSPSPPPSSSAYSPGRLRPRTRRSATRRYGQLALFNEVVRLVLDAYVEPVNVDRAMNGRARRAHRRARRRQRVPRRRGVPRLPGSRPARTTPRSGSSLTRRVLVPDGGEHARRARPRTRRG